MESHILLIFSLFMTFLSISHHQIFIAVSMYVEPSLGWGVGGEGGMICLDGYRMKVRDGTTVYVYRKVRSHRSGTQNTLHIVPILTDVQYACVKFFG